MMKKPYVICHMVTSIDGRILGNRWGRIPGPKDSTTLYETTAASFGVGAWLVGTTTMDEFDAPRKFEPKKAKAPVSREDFIAVTGAKSLGIGVDAKGITRWRDNDIDGDHAVLLVTDQVSDDFLAHLQAAEVSYLFCGKTEVDLRVALDKLVRHFKLKKLMLEGGGTFNGSMLAAGLVDEISQIIVPIVDGGVGVTGIFDVPGDAPKKAQAVLKSTSHKKLPGGANWFRYKVAGKPTGK
jgi:2,5-diamino-6-(ribosylamino)-4(3H)-pyrimidinone 5'-phosphate reductase